MVHKKYCIAEWGGVQPPNNVDFPSPRHGSAAHCILVSNGQRSRHHLVWTWLLESQPYLVDQRAVPSKEKHYELDKYFKRCQI